MDYLGYTKCIMKMRQGVRNDDLFLMIQLSASHHSDESQGNRLKWSNLGHGAAICAGITAAAENPGLGITDDDLPAPE